MQAQGLAPGHRNPEELPASALIDPVPVRMRHDDEHGLAGADPVAVTLVVEASFAGNAVLEHGERHRATTAPVPVVAGPIGDLEARAGRHHMQPVAPLGQRYGPPEGAAVNQILQHKITPIRTVSLCSGTVPRAQNVGRPVLGSTPRRAGPQASIQRPALQHCVGALPDSPARGRVF
ncbi:protein of unknown function [Pararobbsia alpina]